MKNYKLFIVTLFLTSIVSYGQNFPLKEHFQQKKEKIKALKVAFITNELELTSEEAAKFWPVYNAFEDKQQEIKKKKLKAYLERTDANSIDKLSEKDAEVLLSQMESTEDVLYQLKKKFIYNLKGVLSINKILKLKKAEEKFNKKLLQQYRDKKNNR
jgi:Spy/CpxP family protein refolding chaperone